MKRGSIFIVSLLMLVGVIILLLLIGKLGINGFSVYDGKVEGKFDNLALQKNVGITGNSVFGDLGDWFEKLFGVNQFSPVNTSNSYFDGYADNITNNTGINQSSVVNVIWDGASAYRPVNTGTSEVVPDTNTALLLHFNGNVLDSSGNGNNGAITGDVNCSVAGKFNQGCYFNENGSYVSLPTPDIIENLSGVTISFWAKTDQVDPRNRELFFSNVNNNQIVARINVGGGGQFSPEWRNESGSFSSMSTTSPWNNNANWHHILTTFNGSTNLWVDGVYQGNGSAISGNTETGGSGQIFRIGGGTATLWNGTIDEFVVWNRSLTQTEITAIYNLGSGGISGTFKSNSIGIGGANALKGKWSESVNGVTQIDISSNGINWCALFNDVLMTNATCGQLPASSLIYKASFNADTNLDNINLTWQTVTSVCGNGIVELGEQCDDNNSINGDGCSSTCQIEIAGGIIYVDNQLINDCIGTYSIINRNCGGNDGNAYNKLFDIVNILNPGDVVEVRGGTYNDTQLNQGSIKLSLSNVHGSPGNLITLKNYNDENVKIEGSGLSWQVVDIADSSYINISGFKITGGNNGLRIYRSTNILSYHITSYGNNGEGIMIGGDNVTASDYNTVSACEVFNNGLTGILVGNRGGMVKTYNTIIENCLVYDNGWLDPDSSGEGAYVSDNAVGATQNTTFKNNVGFRNPSAQFACENSYNCFIEDNIMLYAGYNNWTDAGGNYGDGRGGKMGTADGGQWNRNHLLRGNVIIGNDILGFGSDGFTGNNYFYQNIIVGNGHRLWGNQNPGAGIYGEGVYFGFYPGTEMKVKNNIIWGNSPDIRNPSVFAGMDRGFNLWNNSNGFAGPTDIEGQNPQFVDYDVFGINLNIPSSLTIEQKLEFVRNQVKQKFSLQAGSPAIDNGTIINGYHCTQSDNLGNGASQTGCAHWYGSAPDIGAYEYNPGTTGCVSQGQLNIEIQRFVNTQIGIVDVTNKVVGYLGC